MLSVVLMHDAGITGFEIVGDENCKVALADCFETNTTIWDSMSSHTFIQRVGDLHRELGTRPFVLLGKRCREGGVEVFVVEEGGGKLCRFLVSFSFGVRQVP